MTYPNTNSEIITNGQASNLGPNGILPGQSMFVSDSSRQGICDARSSFIRFLNEVIFSQTPIAIDRPEAISNLTAVTPIDPYLIWHRPVGVQHIEPIPPHTEWDYEVFTLYDRDRLLLDPVISSNILDNTFPRILVNGLGNEDAPQWCVYDTTLPVVANVVVDANYLANNPGEVFSIAPSYSYHVATLGERDNLLTSINPPSIGDRILVDGNAATYNFWTVWKYTGGTSFALTRYQTYATSDFWSLVDWYDSGYSAANPPVVVYPTIATRNVTEGAKPQTNFVKVSDNGTGSWIWTTFVNGTWVIVAQQNGTITFSPKFYNNPSAPVIGLDPISQSDLANITTRDGSWELRYLFDALRDFDLLQNIEVNESFFSMLHFVHAQQDQVAWAFKTSFMNIGGYNEPLIQTPIQPIDISTSLINYIDEVKPYRVTVRSFTTIYTPPIDYVNAHVSDFDNPPYYDNAISSYRPLSLTNPEDLLIYQTTQPWKNWYYSYANTGTDPKNYDPQTWNPVRHFNIKMIYDRVDHMPVVYTQDFLFTTGNSLGFTISTVNVNLTTKIVEVFVGDTRLPNAAFTVIGADTFVLANAPTDQSWVSLVVRDNLTTGLEAQRISAYYSPILPENPEKNIRRLMDMEFKENQFDGGQMNSSGSDFDIDGNSSPGMFMEHINPPSSFYGLADPGIDADRPPELIVLTATESLNMILYDNGSTVTGISYSTSRPGNDLLAPVEVGDFDERPLDTLVYDVGEVVASNSYVTRYDSWQVTQWGQVGGVLSSEMDPYSEVVVLTTSNSGVMPFTLPVKELLNLSNSSVETTEIITKPGVVWINGERIEFLDYTVNGTIVTLRQITRGTHNTRICVQQSLQGVYSGDGSTLAFTLPDADVSNVVVVVNGILTYANGVVITPTAYNTTIPKSLNIDYTGTNVLGNAVITFFNAPAVGTTVYITKYLDLVHPVGSNVLNGAWHYQDQNDYFLVGNSVSNTVTVG